MTDGIERIAGETLLLVRSLSSMEAREVNRRLDKIRRIEEGVDAAFDRAATQIMNLEVSQVNPDYFLDLARGLDHISDLLERTALLLEWKKDLDDVESELLTSAASQVQQLAEDISACVASLGNGHKQVEQYSETIAEREKVVDQISHHYHRVSSKKGYDVEKRLWLTEVIGNLDAIADCSRDLTITMRAISNKLEKQRRLDIKKGRMT